MKGALESFKLQLFGAPQITPRKKYDRVQGSDRVPNLRMHSTFVILKFVQLSAMRKEERAKSLPTFRASDN